MLILRLIFLMILVYKRFFVVANAMVSFHNLLMIALQIFGGKMEFTGFRLLSVAILDMVNI